MSSNRPDVDEDMPDWKPQPSDGHDLTEDDHLMYIAGATACYSHGIPAMDDQMFGFWFGGSSSTEDADGHIRRSEWKAGGRHFTVKQVAAAVIRFLDRFPLADKDKESLIRGRMTALLS